jgi:hypothetical protein
MKQKFTPDYFLQLNLQSEENNEWDEELYILEITQWSQLKANQRFGGTCRLHLYGWNIGLEDGCDMFLRNVGWFRGGATVSKIARENLRIGYFTIYLLLTWRVMPGLKPKTLFELTWSQKTNKKCNKLVWRAEFDFHLYNWTRMAIRQK